MDLLSTLSGMTPEASADALASAFASEGDGSDCCGGELTFHASLTSLLGPPPTDDTHVEALAAAVAELEAADATPEDAGASVWPLAVFLGAAEVMQGASANPNGTQAGTEDVLVTAASEIALGADDTAAEAELAAVEGEGTTGAGGETPIGADGELLAVSPVVEPEANAEPEGLAPQARGSGGPATTSDPAADASGRARPGSDGAPQVDDDVAPSRLAGDQGRANDAARLRVSDRAEAQRPAPRADPVAETPRVSAGTVAENPAPQGVNASMQGRATLGMADGVRRVLEAIELLENAPPPRQLTIEIGEGRLRVALEDGQVRLSVMDGGSEDLDEFLRTAEEALAEHGFDLGGDGPRDEPSSDQPTTTDQQRRPPTRSAAPGLRL